MDFSTFLCFVLQSRARFQGQGDALWPPLPRRVASSPSSTEQVPDHYDDDDFEDQDASTEPTQRKAAGLVGALVPLNMMRHLLPPPSRYLTTTTMMILRIKMLLLSPTAAKGSWFGWGSGSPQHDASSPSSTEQVPDHYDDNDFEDPDASTEPTAAKGSWFGWGSGSLNMMRHLLPPPSRYLTTTTMMILRIKMLLLSQRQRKAAGLVGALVPLNMMPHLRWIKKSRRPWDKSLPEPGCIPLARATFECR